MLERDTQETQKNTMYVCIDGDNQLCVGQENYWIDIKDTMSPSVGTNEGVISSEEKSEKDLKQLLL